MSEGQMIVGGFLLLVVAFVLRRTFSQSKTSRGRDPLQEAHAEIRNAEAGYAATINKMEVRLNEYAREVEGRIDTKITVLDRLIVEAEGMIKRLEELTQTRTDTAGTTTMNNAETLPAPPGAGQSGPEPSSGQGHPQ